MKYTIVLVGVFLCFLNADAAECEYGWRSYKDEYCVKVFNDFVTYDDAKYFCASQSSGVSTATLVMVKDSDTQNFLAEYTKETYEHVWLGGRFNGSTRQFQWDDGDPISFTNWAEGYPRDNSEGADLCIHLKPKNAKSIANTEGKWEDASCQRRNLPMCQRIPAWSSEDTVKEILNLRKRLEATEIQLEDTKAKLEAVSSRVVPVGSMYVEYYNQPSPTTLWPDLSWEDVTSSYAGLFFRALGGNAGVWGESQSACTPQLSSVSYFEATEQAGRISIDVPNCGWSEYVAIGRTSTWDDNRNEWLKFHNKDCEVRPANQAIRMWKRTA